MNPCCHQKIFGSSSLSHIFFSLKMEMWNEHPCANQHKPDQKEYAITCRLICKHCEKTVSGSFSQFERCNVRFQHIVRRPASHAFSLRGEHVIFKHPTAFRLLLQTSSKNEEGKRNKSHHICGQSHPCKKTMQAKIISAHIKNICIYINIQNICQISQVHVQAHLKALRGMARIPSTIRELQYRAKGRQSIRALFRWKLPLN